MANTYEHYARLELQEGTPTTAIEGEWPQEYDWYAGIDINEEPTTQEPTYFWLAGIDIQESANAIREQKSYERYAGIDIQEDTNRTFLQAYDKYARVKINEADPVYAIQGSTGQQESRSSVTGNEAVSDDWPDTMAW